MATVDGLVDELARELGTKERLVEQAAQQSTKQPVARVCTLATAPVGARVRIRHVGDGPLRAQAIRLGVGQATELVIWARLPGGPIIVERAGQRVAVGRELAREIWVEVVDAT